MNALQKKIYDYFDRNPELKVLFIFQNSAMSALVSRPECNLVVSCSALFHFESAEQNKMEKVWRKGEMYVNFAAKPCKCRRYA